jgi:hypothetical protein
MDMLSENVFWSGIIALKGYKEKYKSYLHSQG